MQKSSEAEIRALEDLVGKTSGEILRLRNEGWRVHVVWDFDSVLCTSRSDDICALRNNSLPEYFDYEERMLFECPERECWTNLADQCGKLHETQDIVTARSSFLALRVVRFVLQHNLSMRWQLFIGHQSKKESYRIILASRKEPNWHVFLIDDGEKHIGHFREIAGELGWGERAHGILAPRVRRYTQEEMGRHYHEVVSRTGSYGREELRRRLGI